jgi:hypothetical protein
MPAKPRLPTALLLLALFAKPVQAERPPGDANALRYMIADELWGAIGRWRTKPGGTAAVVERFTSSSEATVALRASV